ncbi:Sip3p KNAG_0F00580 [Huiozyma naganishii CBS 8797]|uniref:PH domain-containing protein n=1 Tax=Huiozyma naganishii (strain ATCC MYA-139 / BCRC 22969 / CBS 8797 / KCTC 17520 / NBRC 10181 / NCYC 3082 / Yp74L-3) TaxID=1071383 RepID=J7RZR0_HUIN7|nr:hypothetical protein KNAG_0F00580 [Kazachstania naganishii CBS 8797]CCK70727.1 hypothetical protein KNAG_0F00580 [Kazachstania naganishii CBS 8797]
MSVATMRKQLKLISVEFKEASMDSPSFRAHVNFFHTRIEMFEDRLQKTISFYDQKYKPSFEDFQRTKETLLTQLFPSPVMLSNGLVRNQTWTPNVIDRFNKDYKVFFDKIVKMVVSEDTDKSSQMLVDLMTDALEPYKSKRKTFEYFQTKYDNMLNTYQGTEISSTSVDPIGIMNDAKQLHEIRKNYLMASLELVEAISTVKLHLDKYLMDCMKALRKKSVYQFKETGYFIDLCPNIGVYFDDYMLWVKNTVEGHKILLGDMEHAKKQVYEYAVNASAPSTNINDYNLQSLHNFTSVAKHLSTPKTCPEKSGWLYMKTTVGKLSREVWVRRWCFLQNGVFGMFLLSPSKIYVEETDKFGVLIMNIRHNLEENRKYCFEIKIFNGNLSSTKIDKKEKVSTRDLPIVLQAESLKELKSWLDAFETTKKYVQQLDKNTLAYELPYKRFSPKFFEFASSTTTSVDQYITTFDKDTASLLETLNCSFSEYDVLTIGEDKIYEYQMEITPLSTKMTQLAILGNYFTKGSWFPNAILANVWGTTNWSQYSVFGQSLPKSSLELGRSHKAAINSENYPEFFTRELRIGDLQLKNTFFTIDQHLTRTHEEFLLFKFNSIWYPNPKQRFPSISYVTKDNIYCYMNTMGFVCLTRVDMTKVISVEIDKKEPRRLILYDIDNTQYKFDIFFTKRSIVATKLQILIENKASKDSKKLEELYNRLADVDAEYQEKMDAEQVEKEGENLKQLRGLTTNHLAHSFPHNGNLPVVSRNKDNPVATLFQDSRLLDAATFWNIGEATTLLNKKKDLQRDASVMYRHDYDIPSKGLMHILFGDLSTAFPRSFFLANTSSSQQLITFWNKREKDGDIILERSLTFPIDTAHYLLNSGKLTNNETKKELSIRQMIVKAIDNTYYEVEQDPVYIKLPFCHNMKITAKYIITQVYNPEEHVATKLQTSSSGSLLEVFYDLHFIDDETDDKVTELNYFERWLETWAMYFTNFEFLLIKKVIRYYLERIGNHGKVIRAMKICGLLGVSSQGNDTDKEIDEKERDDGILDRLERHTKEETKKDSTKTTLPCPPFVPKRNRQIVYSLSILLKILLKLVIYRLTNIILIIFKFQIGCMVGIRKYLRSLNRTVLLCLIGSVLLNTLLSGKTTMSYWAVKRAETSFKQFAKQSKLQDVATRRAIYTEDLEVLTQDLAVDPHNLAYQKFNDVSSKESNKFKESRTELAIRRNELLVELKILQNMEREIIHGDYRKFLLEETAKCARVRDHITETYEEWSELQLYCTSCMEELSRLEDLLL